MARTHTFTFLYRVRDATALLRVAYPDARCNVPKDSFSTRCQVLQGQRMRQRFALREGSHEPKSDVIPRCEMTF